MARKMRSKSEVELNLASMLDMAFQLLAFFILTFEQPPAEAQILMRMPPPMAVIGMGTQAAGQDPNKKPEDVKPVKTLTITVAANDSGGIGHIEVGVPSVGMDAVDFPKLSDKLADYFAKSAGTFEQVLINASPDLHYGELMRVVEICTNQTYPDGTRLQKLSFVPFEIENK